MPRAARSDSTRPGMPLSRARRKDRDKRTRERGWVRGGPAGPLGERCWGSETGGESGRALRSLDRCRPIGTICTSSGLWDPLSCGSCDLKDGKARPSARCWRTVANLWTTLDEYDAAKYRLKLCKTLGRGDAQAFASGRMAAGHARSSPQQLAQSPRVGVPHLCRRSRCGDNF